MPIKKTTIALLIMSATTTSFAHGDEKHAEQEKKPKISIEHSVNTEINVPKFTKMQTKPKSGI